MLFITFGSSKVFLGEGHRHPLLKRPIHRFAPGWGVEGKVGCAIIVAMGMINKENNQ
tara:strand:- start:366 stop:536 length:171 start_codon:yes stop_codon:yes gene_type:complete